jgi:hypothetical protein
MLRKMTALLSLLLALGLTMSASGQEASSMEEELPGLESAYSRLFMPDFDAMFAALETPGADVEFDEDGVIMVMTMVFTFDSEDNAANAMDTLHEGFFETGEEAETEETEVEDLGDQALMFSAVVEESGEPLTTISLFVQEGEHLYMVTVGGGELEAGKQQTQDIGQFMVDAEITTDEVTFNEDGTSTGGVFDLMPTADDTELVGGLAPSSDMDMMEGFEASTP